MSALDAVVATPRLRLELITPAEAAAMLAGRRGPTWHPDYPRRDDLDALTMMPKDPAAVSEAELSWCPRHVVRAFDGLVVGSIGFFGPPQPAADGVEEVEVGYGLVAEARGHGAATEALRGLLRHVDPLHDRLEDYVCEETCRGEIESTARHGQLIPALGRKIHGDPNYDIELIYGARRLFVARHLNKPLLVELRPLSDREAIVAMEIENRHRKDLSSYERGTSYARMLRTKQFKSQDDLARTLKVSGTTPV